MRGFGIAGVVLAVTVTAAAQDVATENVGPDNTSRDIITREMKAPRLVHAEVDWEAARADLDAIEAPGPAASLADRLARLNRAVSERFANIAASPVPVLLPFDTAGYLRERAASEAASAGAPPSQAGNHLAGFQGVPFFYAGPAGYDAVVVASAQEMRELDIGHAEPIYVHVSGSALLYALDEPVGMVGWPVTGGLETDFPGIRRLYLENYVRYAFVRYGVPYTISIDCFDGAVRFRKASCRDADKIAVHLLKALRVAGGTARPLERIEPIRIERPAAQSTVFTYHSPGDLIPGTSVRSRAGVADYTVYANIRFPMADAPAFANSQLFMNWSECEGTGRDGAGLFGNVAAYRCRVHGRTLIRDQSAAANYSYPWRDNFCEHRSFLVGQCPGGLGHQGQDIRPASCQQRAPGANRCEPYQHDLVAVRDGAVLRAPGQEALYVVVNAPNERIRFRYLHMHPGQSDAAGMLSGRFVREGEVIGKVGNYFRRERGTSYHLHFDVQVPTKYGWVFVNPYMTLVAAYERLIHGRGQEIAPDIRPDTPDDLTTSVPAPPAPAVLPVGGMPQPSDPPAPPASVAAKPTESRANTPPPEGTESEEARP